MSSVKIYKLSNGDEIIGRVGDNPNQISKPRVIQVMQSAQGVGASLIPWMMMAHDVTVDLNPDHIVASVDAAPDVERTYLQQTSGIDLTSKF